MNRIEELEARSNAELNELAAIKLLWNGIVNVPSDDWKPTEDMNQAVRLAEIVFDTKGLRLRLERGPDDDYYFAAFVTTPQSHVYHLSKHTSPSRAITIAAILAKESE